MKATNSNWIFVWNEWKLTDKAIEIKPIPNTLAAFTAANFRAPEIPRKPSLPQPNRTVYAGP